MNMLKQLRINLNITLNKTNDGVRHIYTNKYGIDVYTYHGKHIHIPKDSSLKIA